MRYPCGIKKEYTIQKISHQNRGMALENEINESNEYYLKQDIAVIYKKPTPITIAKVNYPSRDEAVIKEAYFKTPSTTDYNGIYKGCYIDFEAKETQNLQSFPLKNIHKHQIEHLKKIEEHGGIAFVLIRFCRRNQTYYLGAKDLLHFIQVETKQSIPISYLEQYGQLMEDTLRPRIDYLKVIDRLYFGGNKNE